jgi:hypothetical protein
MTGPVADLIRPPYVTVSWTATGFTTEFNGYRVYRRPARLPVAPWAIIGDISVPDIVIATAGESTARTQIEAQHTKFIDYEAGWAAGGYTEGWDYATTVRTKNGLESLFSTLVTGKTITAARNPWLCSNAKPYLNTPIRMYVNELETAVESAAVQNRYLGRDFTMTRTPSELPSRTLESAARVAGRRSVRPVGSVSAPIRRPSYRHSDHPFMERRDFRSDDGDVRGHGNRPRVGGR